MGESRDTDEHMKMVRDETARDAYVRDEGINIGVEQGNVIALPT